MHILLYCLLSLYTHLLPFFFALPAPDRNHLFAWKKKSSEADSDTKYTQSQNGRGGREARGTSFKFRIKIFSPRVTAPFLTFKAYLLFLRLLLLLLSILYLIWFYLTTWDALHPKVTQTHLTVNNTLLKGYFLFSPPSPFLSYFSPFLALAQMSFFSFFYFPIFWRLTAC